MNRKLLIGLVGGGAALLLVCCVGLLLFVNWSNRPENVAAFAATDAAQAVHNTQSAATATAASAALAARLLTAQPVFTETFEDGSPFLQANLGGLSLFMRDGVPEISLAFAADHVWLSGPTVQDFIAELDCSPVGEGAFCGLAYGVHPKDPQKPPPDFFYASYLAAGGNCGFLDQTGGFSANKTWSCGLPPSPAVSPLNRLRVEKAGSRLRFYVNGALMDERTLGNAEALSGGVGVYLGRTSGSNSGTSSVQIDNFKVWQLPPASP